LAPKSWNPEKAFDGLDIDKLPDGDLRMEKAYEPFMAEWAKAPANNDAALKEFRSVIQISIQTKVFKSNNSNIL
jgi:hypothetical protein